jgi:FkbM family methyltransferase
MPPTRREIKSAVARWVPEPLKRLVRQRMFGYRAAGVRFALDLRDEDGVVAATVDGRYRLRLPAAARPDLRYHFAENGESVEEMHALLAAARDPGGLLFDVGAHRGLFSCFFALAGAGSRAVAFEPSPVLAADVRSALAMNGLEARVQVREAALGSRTERVPASVDAGGLIVLGQGDGEAEVTTLDVEAARFGIPDVLKVDVEGYEHEVLEGGREMLRERRPLLLLELHLNLLEGRGIPPREVVEGLVAHGYRFSTPLGRPLSPAALYDSMAAVVRCVAR